MPYHHLKFLLDRWIISWVENELKDRWKENCIIFFSKVQIPWEIDTLPKQILYNLYTTRTKLSPKIIVQQNPCLEISWKSEYTHTTNYSKISIYSMLSA